MLDTLSFKCLLKVSFWSLYSTMLRLDTSFKLKSWLKFYIYLLQAFSLPSLSPELYRSFWEDWERPGEGIMNVGDGDLLPIFLSCEVTLFLFRRRCREDSVIELSLTSPWNGKSAFDEAPLDLPPSQRLIILFCRVLSLLRKPVLTP